MSLFPIVYKGLTNLASLIEVEEHPYKPISEYPIDIRVRFLGYSIVSNHRYSLVSNKPWMNKELPPSQSLTHRSKHRCQILYTNSSSIGDRVL